MLFLYRYEKGGEVREGEVAAPSQGEAYSVLRKSGIRPMKVWQKPGLLNRLSFGKRWYAIILLSLAFVAVFSFAMREHRHATESAVRGQIADALMPLPRQQFGLASCRFDFESEKLLSLFVRPAEDLPENMPKAFPPDLSDALATPLVADPADPSEVIVLKRILTGIKQEVELALRAGESEDAVFARLVRRQKTEAAYRASIIRDTPSDEVNETLRAMSFKEDCSFPVEKGGFQGVKEK